MEVIYCGNIPSIAAAIDRSIHTLKAIILEDGDDRQDFAEFQMKGIAVLRVPNKELLKAAIESVGSFDIGVLGNFGYILPKTVIDLPEHGFVNAHPGRLPENKGREPIVRSLLEKHPTTGITLHKVTEYIDEGEIIDFREIIISDGDTKEILGQKLYQLAGQIIVSHLESLETSSIRINPNLI